ncbi:hypothetical protein GXM_05117 [Nostoc sphaeroides CCNUC1]|uniref:Uncharacterized protein n=1 Tax=Nostoc sphaeroides CCNUC1 TaxID=2653204 RepID=A0A5P8W4F9_9NOSO|nr:hypothetical protein GXM_05117 [Nostoc sphaeroides CCNUC1]
MWNNLFLEFPETALLFKVSWESLLRKSYKIQVALILLMFFIH